jgi:outer membrane protein assembly factor BamB
VVWDERLFLTTAVSGSGHDSLKVGLYGDIDEVNDRSVHEFRVYCIDKYSGEILWERLAHRGIPGTDRHTKTSHANPTPATNGKLFYSTEQGGVCVVKAGKGFELISVNPLDDLIMASPAISENMLYFRTQHYLIAAGKQASPCSADL